ncbi:Cupin 1 [Corchorus olitorius]|uniref:Cupin 1 n=1 Tax=Corchorus olitorius TaxID=93759 RepID=A0A1R3IT01_9ROSI|nr:Cupin 1 [Corchorus olitorius]
MVISKSHSLVLIYSLLLSFALLSSAACVHGRKGEQDPYEEYDQCQRRCEWEVRGERQQEQCEQRCERQLEERLQSQHRRRGLNPEDPQRRYEECQQWCEQQAGRREQPQCQQKCQGRFQQEKQAQRQLQQCQERCERQEQGQREQQQCQSKCQQQVVEQQRQLQQCQERCERQEQEGQPKWQQCQSKCQQEHEQRRQQQEQEGYNPHRHTMTRREEEEEEPEQEEEQQQQQRNNPYFFPYRRSFQSRFREEEGRFNILQRFAHKSPLLKLIDNYRLATFEVNPQTFVIPHHCDSHALYVVTNGKGVITFVNDENKIAINVETGTVLKAHAGATVYMVNHDNREKLNIAVLAIPVNTPGKFEEFFPAGNRDPQSFIQVFSSRVLEAVFNSPREQIERIFRPREQQGQKSQQGIFRRAEAQQIRSLTQQATSPGEKGTESLAFNLMRQSPIYSNQNGRFFEAKPENFKQLQDFFVSVAAFQINKESIFVPHFNTKATFLVLVTEGSANVEMACPHLSRQSQSVEQEQEQQEEERSGEFKQVRAKLSAGDVFVVPAAHPVTYFTSQNQNFKAIAFGLNGPTTRRVFVAGKNNLVRQMDSEAKEISFGIPSKLIDEVFNKPQESHFMSFSPQQRQPREEEMRGNNNRLSSILEFARMF